MDRAGLHVAVLQGGASTEREVSLESGAAVLAALGEAGFAAPVPVRLERDGAWDWDGDRLAAPAALARLAEVDCVFLALHGGDGEDGTLQAALELVGVAYTGSGVAASALAMDKVLARDLLAVCGVRVARAIALDRASSASERTAALDALPSPSGWIVKPRRGGSSVGVVPVEDPGALGPAVDAALAEAEAVLVEERVVGVEATCAVLDGPGGPSALTPVEILPAEGRWFDYEQKYAADGALERCPPEALSAPAQARLREVALLAHARLGCAGLTRTDFIVPLEDGRAAEPVFLELNTLPGLTARSLSPLAAAQDGIPFPELCARLVEDALARRRAARP